jgi:putative ABC transport system permease protein
VRALDRKLLREFSRAKGLLLAITSIVIIGVTCFVTMQSAYHNLNEAKSRYYRQCRMADFWIEVKKVPLSELEPVARLPGISEIHPRIQFYATVDLEGVERPLNAAVVSLPERRDRVINDIVLRRGDYFTDRRDNEVIVTASFARAHGLRPGQWIHLLLNNRRQEMFVVGTALGSEFTYMLAPGAIMPDPKQFGVFYIKRKFAEEVFDFQSAANQIVGHLTPNERDHPDEVLRRAETLLEPYGVFTTTPLKLQASNQYLSNEIEGLRVFAVFMPVVFLGAAALILNVLIMRLARQQRVVIGTLKALGYSDRQVFAHFIQFGLGVGLVGGLVGSVLGYWLAAGMTRMYQQFFEFPDLYNGFYPYVYAVALAVSLLCALAGCLFGARSTLRLKPAEAMRPAPPRRGGKILLERLDALWRRLGTGWRMALRGIFRNRLRTAAGIFAAMMGTSLLVTGFMMNEGSHYLLDFQFFRVMRSDVDLAFRDQQGWDAWLEVRQLPGMDFAEPRLQVACTLVNGPYRRKSGVTGLLPSARLTVPRDRQGEAIELPEVGLVIDRRLSQLMHLAAGDMVTLIPVRGDRRPVRVPVQAIADSYLGLTAYAQIGYLSRLVGEELAVTEVQLATDRDTESRTQLYRQLQRLPGVQSISLRSDMIKNLVATMLETQYLFIGVWILFAGVLFFGSVLNASLVSLAERQREVGTLIALGYSRWQVGAMFMRESLVTNVAGTLIGFPIGYALTVLMVYAYENDVIRLPLLCPPSIWLWTIILSTLFALAAHGVVQWRIFRLDYLESLKVQE